MWKIFCNLNERVKSIWMLILVMEVVYDGDGFDLWGLLEDGGRGN